MFDTQRQTSCSQVMIKLMLKMAKIDAGSTSYIANR